MDIDFVDDNVRGFLDDAKKAVNGIQEAMDEGYTGEDGGRLGVVSTEGDYFREAMKGLEKYSLEHVDGFKKGDINNRSTSASLRNIETWQGSREELNGRELTNEELEMMDGTYIVPSARNSEEEYEIKVSAGGVKDVLISANEMNENAHYVHGMTAIGPITFNATPSENYGMSDSAKFYSQLLIEQNDGNPMLYIDRLGDIDLGSKGIKSFRSHNDWEHRQSFISAVIPVLQNGRIVAGDKYHKGKEAKNKKYGTITLAAKVTMAGDANVEAGEYYVGVTVERTNFRSGDRKQRLHVIDFYAIKREGIDHGRNAVESIDDPVGAYNTLSLNQILSNIASDVNIYITRIISGIGFPLARRTATARR